MHSLDIIIDRNRKAVIREWQEEPSDERALRIVVANKDVFCNEDVDMARMLFGEEK